MNLTFIEDDGTEVKVEAECGATLLEVAHDNDIDLEGENDVFPELQSALFFNINSRAFVFLFFCVSRFLRHPVNVRMRCF